MLGAAPTQGIVPEDVVAAEVHSTICFARERRHPEVEVGEVPPSPGRPPTPGNSSEFCGCVLMLIFTKNRRLTEAVAECAFGGDKSLPEK
jgi:hypothetical protein